ncbi:regulatory particle non-ATPase 10 isoform X2 [Oratosquilla oratoria]|uniref:regulatory particle non-ATPase 10 isoform X2 n=1 Tax=Oratosquilla oratoria TaxID=337810 RepID=UPI003F76C4AC
MFTELPTLRRFCCPRLKTAVNTGRMGLESTIICIDNSEYMRNGDYLPTRLAAQQDAVNTICRSKLRSNPENNVGLLTLANTEVLATLTTDVGKILTSLHKVQPEGEINLLTGIRIAHLALKHRLSKTHKMRIVAFVGSPVTADEKEIVKLAKRLKKEKVNIDVINFGETVSEDWNQTLLESLVSTINGREGNQSHLVTIPPSPHLSNALISSPIVQGEDGAPGAGFASGGGFEFGVDPNEDPELALALRVSMEEQRQRQQEEERRAAQESVAAKPAETATTPTSAPPPPPASTTPAPTTPAAAATPTAAPAQEEEEMLQQALAMSLEGGPTGSATFPTDGIPDFSAMTEEEQIAYAMQMSMQDCQPKEEPMEVDVGSQEDKKAAKPKEEQEQDFSEVIADPAFLQSVLQNLPGVDPQSQAVKDAVGSLTQDKKKDSKNDKDEKK